MVAEQKTKDVLKQLKKAGWKPIRTKGSHTTWKTPTGKRVTVPDGHTTISPGVYRQILKVLKENQ